MDRIQLLGRKSCIRDIKFKIFWVSKSIPVAKSQNFVDISRAQKPTWAKFLEFESFLSEKTRLHIYYQNKNQLVVTSSSCINLTIKLLIKLYLLAPKQDKSKILLFGGKQHLTFASDRLFILSGFIVLQGMVQVNEKSEFNLFWKINNGILKLPKNLIY